MYAHLSCARRIGKTCGLPADYAQIYLDAVERNLRDHQEKHLGQREQALAERMDTF